MANILVLKRTMEDKMKKFVVFLCSMFFLFGVAPSAGAIPTSWTDKIDWSPDVSLEDAPWWKEASDDFSYFHDLGNDGFVSYFEGGDDYIDSYNLRVRLYDDDDSREGAVIFQPGLLDPDTSTKYDFSWDFADIGWTLAGLVDINHDGTLNVLVEPTRGDFYLDWSEVIAYGDNGDPVPEPATMLLLGCGLIGLAAVGRKMSLKKN
jgi:hypothetical protein